MLFKKSPPPAPTVPRRYTWEKPDRAVQSLWISVADWQYKVFPSRQSQRFGSWMFQFEGNGRTDPLKDLIVTGSIEVLDRGETPGMLSDRWASVPDNVEGYAFFMDSNDSSILPSVGVTLYCQEAALDWVYRAFSTASSSRSGGLGIELKLDCPNNQGGDFWHDQWQGEWLRVVSWQLYAGAQLRPPQ